MKLAHFPYDKRDIENLQPSIIRDATIINRVIEGILNGRSFKPGDGEIFLKSCAINHNTSFLIDCKFSNKIQKMLFERKIKIEDLITEKGSYKENKVIIEILIIVFSISKKDAKFLQMLLILSPSKYYLYFYMSEIYSPYYFKRKDIPIKINNLKRSTYSDRFVETPTKKICEDIWNATLTNTEHLKKGEYTYPFPVREPTFTRDFRDSEKCEADRFLFFSTPASGTQSLIYYLSFMSGKKFRQFNYHRIYQKEEFFLQDVLGCVEGNFHIHSHFPLPERGIRVLVNAGYKIFGIKRQFYARALSSKRHQYNRPSFYPMNLENFSEVGTHDLEKFFSQNREIFDLMLDFEELEKDFHIFYDSINNYLFPGSQEKFEIFMNRYKRMLKSGSFNFRRNKET